ncbi:MAG: TonB-dependent receptor [Emcibacter sp.]|nr:TonB-dependent receptor [Emcibacter sp.]
MFINIVLKESASSLSGVWKVSGRYFQDGTILPDAQMAATIRRDNSSYSFSIEGILMKDTRFQREIFTDSATKNRLVYDQKDVRHPSSLKMSLGLEHQLSGGASLKINSQYDYKHNNRKEVTAITNIIRKNHFPGGLRTQINSDIVKSGEISALLLTPVTDNLEIEAIAIYTENKKKAAENIEESNIAGETTIEDELNKIQTSETIFQTTTNWSPGTGIQYRIGLEGAYNTYKTQLGFATTDTVGTLVPVKLDNSAADINEKRGQAFAFISWTLLSDVTLDTGSSYEFSRIEQLGKSVNNARSLAYLKPSLQLSYSSSESSIVKAKIERTVGQLSFKNFVSRINSRQDKVEEGNPDLVPTTSWNFSLALDHNLKNDGGTIRITGFYHFISNLIDNIPFGILNSILGNIDKARKYGVEISTGLNMEKLGLVNGGQFETKITWQRGRVQDPFLKTDRTLRYFPNFQFRSRWRQQFPDIGLQGDITYSWQSDRYVFDIDEVEKNSSDYGDLSSNIEHVFKNNITLRLSAMNILNQTHTRIRHVFATSIMDGAISRDEIRRQQDGRTFRLSLQGVF